MKLQNIEILEKDNNKKGDLFGRLMGDLFHALGYDEPRLNIHKSGREIDLQALHRTERKVAIVECKAHKDAIGGDEINKSVGAIDAERRKFKKANVGFDVVGYFVSLSGFKETAIQQEDDLDNDRVILLKPEKIVDELIKGRILVSIEQAVASVESLKSKLTLIDDVNLFAYERGWIWVIKFSDNGGQTASHFALVHAEGKPLIKELADEIINLDSKIGKKLEGLIYLTPTDDRENSVSKLKEAREKYFKYIENECGEIQFEGLPTDKDAGSVRVKLENIFVPLHLNSINEDKEKRPDLAVSQRESIGNILKNHNRLAILAKPGGGKSTLIKRIAVAYAFSTRRKLVNDELPDYKWFPIFIRCRELGDKVSSSITDIINSIPNRAEIVSCSNQFSFLVSDSLQKGNALLLIDGLDEIAEDRNRIAFVNQLRTFIATYPNINIIVTSREAGFRVVGGSLATYCSHFTLAKLNNDEIEDLTIKWHRAIIDDSQKTLDEAKSLAALIIKDNRIKVLAENPLLLTTLLFVKRWVGYLPTKRSLLYQEMIKLLLVTWNVEGHEQLDIDETEPQLAYVAFWMMLNGKQTITEEDLKDCLFAARKQMPDILGYTRISVPQFIKSVESRSSLLIMSGHTRLEDGKLTPVYEFLHLSFQEYLTAKAITEKYLPEAQADKPILEILEPHINKENWKEVIPLVAVLARKGNRELINYLIEKSKKTAYDEVDQRNVHFNEAHPALLLGNCIANEIQISPELLDTALEWIAKNEDNIFDDKLLEIILNSKFADSYRRKVRQSFFEVYDDHFVVPLASSLGKIYLSDSNTSDNEKLLQKILNDIKNNKFEEKCIAILGLTNVAFSFSIRLLGTKRVENPLEVPEIKKIVSQIIEELFEAIKLKNDYFYFSVCWCIAWLGRANLFIDSHREGFAQFIIYKWLEDNPPALTRMMSWGMSEILRPSLDIDFTQYPHIEKKIYETFHGQSDIKNKLCAIYLGLLMGINLNKSEISRVFNEETNRIRNNNVMILFADEFDIEIKTDSNEVL